MEGPLRVTGRRLVLVASLIAATGGFTLAAVLASAALKPTKASVEVSPRQLAGAVAKCRKGQRVVSAGFSSPNFDRNFDQASIFPVRLQRASERRLRARAFNFGAEAPGTFNVHAYCGKRKLGISIAAKRSAPVPSEFVASRSATARCPAGTTAIAGGFRMGFGAGPDSPRLVPHISRRTGERRWTVAAANDGDAPGRFDTFAICAKRAPRLIQASRTKSLAAGATGAVSAACRRGTEAVSGGFRSPLRAVDSSAAGSFPFTSRRAKSRRWRGAYYATEGGPSKATTIVYCAA